MGNALPLVITISRELGSGGALIGQELAKSLGISYADREIIDRAAEQFSVLEKDLESRDEKKFSFWQMFTRAYAVAPDAYVKPQILPPSDVELFKTESEIITRIARERSAVIIGRCGAYILRDHPNHVSLYLHAGLKFRKERVCKLYNVSEEEAEKMIAQSDKERAQYHRGLTGQIWADARRYNLSLATDKVGVEKCAAFIVQYLETRGIRK